MQDAERFYSTKTQIPVCSWMTAQPSTTLSNSRFWRSFEAPSKVGEVSPTIRPQSQPKHLSKEPIVEMPRLQVNGVTCRRLSEAQLVGGSSSGTPPYGRVRELDGRPPESAPKYVRRAQDPTLDRKSVV